MAGFSPSYADNAMSSQTITGNTFGGINLGNQANLRNMPDWLANRISTKPQLIDDLANPSANTLLMLAGGLLIGWLIARRL